MHLPTSCRRGLAPVVVVLAMTLSAPPTAAQPASSPGSPDAATARAAVAALVSRHGEGERARIEQGVEQVLRLWRPEDGDAAAFRTFVEAEFLPVGPLRDATFERFEFALERLGGYMTSLIRDLRRGVDLEIGPVLPLDRRLGGYDPAAHLADDLFANKIAFVALLNFPRTTLEERLAEGLEWTRREWAETRLAGSFSNRVPAEVNQRISQAASAADSYISAYNLFMHHVLGEGGERLFPPDLRLISHWGLRDELKARYTDPQGLAKQRAIARLFDRIVRQEIPAVVIDDPRYDWNPFTNQVTVSAATTEAERSAAGVEDPAPPLGANVRLAREADERYRHWLEVFRAVRAADPYSPDNPTAIERSFEVHREIPESEVRGLFEAVLGSPLGAEVGRVVAERLGRPLEPFDIWYVGFRPRGKYSEAELDALTKARYPTADAFAADLPRLLGDLGFSPERARMLAEHIVVEPSRGAGHAFGAGRRDDKAHLRTRVGADGMDYKGYNIAVHELGHNVEQVFSMTLIDHTLLEGVPNTAFTEALAFLFQHRDLELLGLEGPGAEAEDLATLDAFWSTREIAGVALVDIAAWHWLYDHPEATPAEFREAVVGIAQDVWNRWFAPVFGVRDQTLLAVYSHTIDNPIYTPNYPLGHLIAFQVEDFFRSSERPFGEEFERVSRIGSLTPDAWMRLAVGAPLSAQPLLDATREALAAMGGGGSEAAAARISAARPVVTQRPDEPLSVEVVVVEEGTTPSADGVPIHYLTAGEGEPALVLVHCWSCDAGYWRHQLPSLAADRRVVAVDLGGHGESGRGRTAWTMEAFGRDVAAVAEALELDDVILVGHSMGGYVMLEAARALPGRVRGLVAVDTLLDIEEEHDPQAVARYVAALRRDFPGTTRQAMATYIAPETDPVVAEWILSDMAAGPPEVGVPAFESLIAHDAAAALDELRLPFAAINGRLEPTNEAALRRHAPDAQVIYLDAVGHWPMLERPAAFETALRDAIRWIEKHQSR
ncbi:MAG TPA: alpha/beta hydrolase [Thermoanaerobaculia bacterium]|nr:alpha/beta hydrolase [Thermoanaerobaculia bacterium]